MSESDEEIFITQNTLSGVLFPSIELDEILCNRAQHAVLFREGKQKGISEQT